MRCSRRRSDGPWTAGPALWAPNEENQSHPSSLCSEPEPNSGSNHQNPAFLAAMNSWAFATLESAVSPSRAGPRGSTSSRTTSSTRSWPLTHGESQIPSLSPCGVKKEAARGLGARVWPASCGRHAPIALGLTAGASPAERDGLSRDAPRRWDTIDDGRLGSGIEDSAAAAIDLPLERPSHAVPVVDPSWDRGCVCRHAIEVDSR